MKLLSSLPGPLAALGIWYENPRSLAYGTYTSRYQVLHCEDQTVIAEFEPMKITKKKAQWSATFIDPWDETKLNELPQSSLVLRAQHSEPQDWQFESMGIYAANDWLDGLVYDQCAFDQYTKFLVKSETTAELNGVYTLIDPTDKLQGLKKENSGITMTFEVMSSSVTMQMFQESSSGTTFARRVLEECATDVATIWYKDGGPPNGAPDDTIRFVPLDYSYYTKTEGTPGFFDTGTMQSSFCTNKCISDASPWLAAPSKCKNGGQCVTTDQWHACKCEEDGDFFGYQCEGHQCESHTCDPDGTIAGSEGCTNNGKVSYTCNCGAGWSGDMCQVSPCDSNPCQNGGTCDLSPSVGDPFYTCDCQTGYGGTNCETEPCDTNPCLNGGTCINKVTDTGISYKCICPHQFDGPTCKFTLCNDFSKGNPCKSGGSCDIVGSDFMCTCLTGTLGKTCEETPCTPVNPCNDGTCTVVGNEFTCDCSKTDKIGTTCQLENCDDVKIFGVTCMDDFKIKVDVVQPECFKQEYPTLTLNDLIVMANVDDADADADDSCKAFDDTGKGSNFIYGNADLSTTVTGTTSVLYFDGKVCGANAAFDTGTSTLVYEAKLGTYIQPAFNPTNKLELVTSDCFKSSSDGALAYIKPTSMAAPAKGQAVMTLNQFAFIDGSDTKPNPDLVFHMTCKVELGASNCKTSRRQAISGDVTDEINVTYAIKASNQTDNYAVDGGIVHFVETTSAFANVIPFVTVIVTLLFV